MHRALEARTRIVQSPANRWVKAVRAAQAHPESLARTPYSPGAAPLIVLEGFHLVLEALRSDLAPAAIFLRTGEEHEALQIVSRGLASPALLETTELLTLPPALFRTLNETEAPQPILALLPAPAFAIDTLLTGTASSSSQAPLLLVLAALQDPGNLGTLLRSAEAFGATGALLLTGTATPWSGKSLRASAGSALRLPMVAVQHAGEAGLLLRRAGVRSFAAVASGGTVVDQARLAEACALWIGNEGAGLSEKELAACDARLTLSMRGPTESLNAAVAGSLLLYEAARQRAALSGVPRPGQTPTQVTAENAAPQSTQQAELEPASTSAHTAVRATAARRAGRARP